MNVLRSTDLPTERQVSAEVAHRRVSPLACLPVSSLETRVNPDHTLTCLQLGLHHQASNHQEHPEEDSEAHRALVEDEVPNLWQENKN